MLNSRIKAYLRILLAIPMLGTGIGNIDPWSDYVNFKTSKFYLLENKFFNQITCQVNVPSIATGWTLLKDQLERKADTTLEFHEEFSKFTLHVRKIKAYILTFERPKFEIELTSRDAINNREQIENEIKIVKEGFQKQIFDVERVIRGVFDEYQLAKRSDVDINIISVKGKTVCITYKKADTEREETYLDTLRDVIVKEHGQTLLERNDKFKKIDDKLILESSNIVVINKRDGITVENTISIEYQSLKRIDWPQQNVIHFPRKIADSTKWKINNMTQQVVVDIYLDRCFSR